MPNNFLFVKLICSAFLSSSAHNLYQGNIGGTECKARRLCFPISGWIPFPPFSRYSPINILHRWSTLWQQDNCHQHVSTFILTTWTVSMRHANVWFGLFSEPGDVCGRVLQNGKVAIFIQIWDNTFLHKNLPKHSTSPVSFFVNMTHNVCWV